MLTYPKTDLWLIGLRFCYATQRRPADAVDASDDHVARTWSIVVRTHSFLFSRSVWRVRFQTPSEQVPRRPDEYAIQYCSIGSSCTERLVKIYDTTYCAHVRYVHDVLTVWQVRVLSLGRLSLLSPSSRGDFHRAVVGVYAYDSVSLFFLTFHLHSLFSAVF